MLEISRFVADYLGRDIVTVHPTTKDRNERIGIGLFGSGIGEQHHIDRLASFDELDDHGGGIDARAPGRDHWRALNHRPSPSGRWSG
jgi:hypothetical protein